MKVIERVGNLKLLLLHRNTYVDKKCVVSKQSIVSTVLYVLHEKIAEISINKN